MKQLLLIILCMVMAAPAYAASIGLEPDRWEFRYGKGTPTHPSAEDTGFGFDVPRWSGQIDYLTRKYGNNIRGKTITLRGTIIASPDVVFKAPTTNCPGAPASFRFMVQKRGDDLTTSDGRFWSKAAIRPTAGTKDFMLSTVLIGDNWTNVDGQQSNKGFNRLMENMGNLGVTMVGPNDCSYGHGMGVAVGSAHFVFKSLTVE